MDTSSNADSKLLRSGFRVIQDFVDALPPVFENPAHIVPHLQCMNQPPQNAKWQCVPHHIDHPGSVAVRFKSMGMVPELVGSRSLHVDKTIGRVPLEYLGAPPYGYAMQVQLIPNLRALPD